MKRKTRSLISGLFCYALITTTALAKNSEFSFTNFLTGSSGGANLYLCLANSGGLCTVEPQEGKKPVASCPSEVAPYKSFYMETWNSPYYGWASYNVHEGSCEDNATFYGNLTVSVNNTTNQFQSVQCVETCSTSSKAVCKYCTTGASVELHHLALDRQTTPEGDYWWKLDGTAKQPPPPIPEAQTYQAVPYRGVNLAGGAFNHQPILPSLNDVPYYVEKGMNTIRYPIKWEYIESPIGTYNTDRMGKIQSFIEAVTAKGIYVILDLHNYMRYDGKVIGTAGAATAEDLANLWVELGQPYAQNSHVMFDLMNEPHDMETEDIVTIFNTVIAALRGNKIDNMLLLEGNNWAGMFTWCTTSAYGIGKVSNAVGFATSKPGSTLPGCPAGPPPYVPPTWVPIHDPQNKYLINVHQYFNLAAGGGGGCAKEPCPPCVTPDKLLAVEKAQAFVDWLKANKLKAIMTELGGAPNNTCVDDIDTMLGFIQDNSDVFVGWTIWAGGSAWGNSGYPLNISPVAGKDSRQMTDAIEQHLTPLNP